MKKTIFLCCVIAAFCLSSCKKDRTCTCTITTVYNQNVTVENTEKMVGHVTKKQAKKETDCYSSNGTVTSSGFTEQVTKICKLS